MARKRNTTPDDYEAYTVSRKALVKDAEEFGRIQELLHYITEINSGNSYEFTRTVYAIEDDSLRAEVWAHDAASNSMVKIQQCPHEFQR